MQPSGLGQLLLSLAEFKATASNRLAEGLEDVRDRVGESTFGLPARRRRPSRTRPFLNQTRSRWLMVAAIVAAISACTASQRVVGPNADHLSLTLAVPFADDREAQPFVDAVSRLSNGTIEIDFKGGVHQGEAATEDALLTDVAAGRYDLTWVAQRPWPARGVKSFDALVAPFLIDPSGSTSAGRVSASLAAHL